MKGILPAKELAKKITTSSDWGDGRVTGWVDRVYAECCPEFVADVLAKGVNTPIHVEPAPGQPGWVIHNGHHRFSVAYRHGLDVPFSSKDQEWYTEEGAIWSR